MRLSVKWLALTLVVFAALLGLVEIIAVLLLKPGRNDLFALAGFLFASGGITLTLSIIGARSGLPSWIHSIRTQLLLVSVIVGIIVVINIGFVAYLMFLSPHDLGLLIGLTIFSLGLSILSSLYISQPTIRNLNAVIRAVRNINAGNLEVKVPVESGDEVGELAKAFNAMVQRLRESLERERETEKTRRE